MNHLWVRLLLQVVQFLLLLLQLLRLRRLLNANISPLRRHITRLVILLQDAINFTFTVACR